MTTTPTASPELPDLDKLEALANQVNNGYGSALADFSAADGTLAVLALIALARRAQPEGEAPQAVPTPILSLEDCPEDDQQWAKVDPAVAFHLIERHAEDWADAGRMMLQWHNAISRAAQQAAAPTWGSVHTVGHMVRNLLTLDQAAPIFTAFHVTIDGQRRCRTRGVTISRERVVDGKWIDSACKDVPYTHIIWAKPDERAPSAPGTPEAPKRLTEEEVRELALQHLHDDTESAGRNGFFTFSAEGLDGFAIDLMDSQRAAQLDGGQEGSAT